MNRRFFLKSGGIALASVGVSLSAPTFLERVALGNAITGGKRKTLIAIFQRGAVDGLNVVVPYGDSSYYDLRPNIGIPKPSGTSADTAIDLDGFFGLHPSLSPFKSLWDSKRLAVIHASGSPDNTRSHFDAQDYMESATPGVKSTNDGWLNRYLQSKTESERSLFRAVSITQTTPRVLQGRAPTVAMANMNDFAIRAGKSSASIQGGFEAIYGKSANDSLAGMGRETFEAVNYPKQGRLRNEALWLSSPHVDRSCRPPHLLQLPVSAPLLLQTCYSRSFAQIHRERRTAPSRQTESRAH